MKEERIRENLILTKTFEFALGIIEYVKILDADKNFVLSNQLMKSGTSIGANCWEAQNCESKAYFIHKLKIAAKEADESMYWLLLCKKANYGENIQLLNDLETIQKILNKIIHSSKKKK